MTFAFCDRFIAPYGDRTRDQMIQAARSGKQNIVEGFADGVTSTKTMLNLLNVARGSLHELREDYLDYLKSRKLPIWGKTHPRYDKMLKFCKKHNELKDYEPFFQKWSDEEFCNVGITICHIVDKLMNGYIDKIQVRFVTEGGMTEQMHKARTGYRQAEDEELTRLRQQVPQMEAEIERLRKILKENGIEF